MGDKNSKKDNKISYKKISMIENYKFEVFFLQIILNNPKFALYLINQNYDQEHEKVNFYLKQLAYKLNLDNENKEEIDSYYFLKEFYKKNCLYYIPNNHVQFLNKFFCTDLESKINLININQYNNHLSTKSQGKSIMKSMFFFEALKKDYSHTNNSYYELIPFINLETSYNETNIENYLKKYIETNSGQSEIYFRTFPEILFIYVNRINYYYKITIKQILNLKEVSSRFFHKYDLIGLICKEECFYKNFKSKKWYYYHINGEFCEDISIDEILNKNFAFYLLIYKRERVDYTKEIFELQKIEKMKPLGNRHVKLKSQTHISYRNKNYGISNISEGYVEEETIYPYEGYGKVGLKNIGCTCFMNSVLQCVKNLYQITHHFLTKGEENKELTAVFIELLINLCQNNRQSFSPVKIKTIIGKRDSDFLEYTPNDSKDFLMLLFNCLENENHCLYEEGKFLPKIEDKNEFEKAVKKTIFSEISFLCNFVLKTMIKCQKCKRNTLKFQFYNILDLPIITESGKIINSLIEAIKTFQEEKTIECNCGGFMNRKTVIYTLPEILIIHLLRSNLGGHSEHYVNFKKEFSFDEKMLCESNLKYKDYNYELVGVINHDGYQDGGHNYSYCKNFFDNKWYEYNDDSVTPIHESRITNKKGFLLFYQLKNNIADKNEKIREIVEKIEQNKISTDINYEYYSSGLSHSYNYNHYYGRRYYC